MEKYYQNVKTVVDYFKVCENGKIFKVNLFTGQWDDVSDNTEFSIEWKECSLSDIDNFRLFIYVEGSPKIFEKLESKDKDANFKYGDDYHFYYCQKYPLDCLCAVDNKNDVYLCLPIFMAPFQLCKKSQPLSIDLSAEEIINNFQEIPVVFAMDFINHTGDINLLSMDLYYDENGDIRGFDKDQKQFIYSFDTNELNEVYDNNGVDDKWEKVVLEDDTFDITKNNVTMTQNEYSNKAKLHQYLKVTGNEKGSFEYFADDFFKVYASDKNGKLYFCSDEGLKALDFSIEESYKYPLSKSEVVDAINYYYEHKKILKTKNIVVSDLKFYITSFDELCGVTEDGREFLLSKETGQLQEVDPGTCINKFSKYFNDNKLSVLLTQGKIKANL